MNLQIDIKPIMPRAPFAAWRMNQYINGSCYSSTVSDSTVQELIRDGIVRQVKGERHNAEGKLETFDYPDMVDSSGVQYTSRTYSLQPYQEA